MPFVLRSPYRKITLAKRLGELGQSRRRAMSLRAWFTWFAVGCLWLTVTVLADAVLHLSAVMRAGLLVSGLALLAYRLLAIRRASTLSQRPQEIAALLEARFPKLNDALASAVDFQSKEDSSSSARFRQVAVLRAENLTKRLDLESIVPTKNAWRSFQFATLAALLMLVPAAIYPHIATLGVVRLFDPFGKHPWPTKTQLNLLNPTGETLLLAKGDPLLLRFNVGGVLPETATLELKLSNATPTTESIMLERTEESPDSTTDYLLEASRISRDFSFRIKAGDAETTWFPVTVAPPPRLVPLANRPSPQIDLTFPAYTELPPLKLPDGAGVVEGVSGTVLHFRAAVDRRIVAAFFVPQMDMTNLATQLSVAHLMTTNPIGAYAAHGLAQTAVTPIPVAIVGADLTELEAYFVPNQPGLYQLQFKDERGLVGRRLFDFRLTPDVSPLTTLDRPFVGKDPLMLLPTASVPVLIRAEDRPFAARALHLEYRYNGPEGTWQSLEIIDQAKLPRPGPKVSVLEQERTIPLDQLRKPNGTGPMDGDTLTIRAAGYDWDNRTAMKEPGRSKEVDLRILAKPSLEAEIQKELAALRPDLLRLNEKQREAEATTAELTKKAEAGKLTPEDLATLNAAERDQAEVRNSIAGVRTKVDQLKRTARASNLGRSPTMDKLETTANELNKLADDSLEAAEAALAGAKNNPDDAKATAEQLKKAAQPQQNAATSFKKILEKLEQWASAGEVRGEATAVQDQLNRNAEKASKTADKIEPGTAPDAIPPTERAELNTTADELDRAADRAADLLTKAGRMAQQKDTAAKAASAKASDLKKAAEASRDAGKPEDAAALDADADKVQQAADQAKAEAEALRQAIQNAGGDQLPADLKEAADLTRKQQTGEADKARQSATERLQQFRDALSEKPQPEVDELRKKAKSQTTEQIDRIAEQQDELRKKTKQAEAMPDGAEKTDALKKLAQEQERLRRTTEDLVQRLTRDPDPKAEQNADALRKAADQMDAAREQLDNGKAATDKQEAALDKLDETLDRLDKDKQQDQEQLDREEREQLGEQLKAIHAKQTAAVAEADRLMKAAAADKLWDRPLQRSLLDLAEQQRALSEEVTLFRTKQLEQYPVFNKLVEQAGASMKQANQRILERGDDIADADPDAPFDTVAEAAQNKRMKRPLDAALRKLDQILEALKDDPKPKPKPKDGEPMPMGDMPPPEDQPKPPGNGLPPTAQLKALRAMQVEVNERTKKFAEEHPDPDKLNKDDQAELKELEQAQQDVAELFEKLAAELREKGGM